MGIKPLKFFQSAKEKKPNLTLDSPIAEHAAFINELYLASYPDGSTREDHGVCHADRAAAYVINFLSLRKKYGDKSADISEREIKILQLLALFHDSGREDDGVDLWDKDSATNFYNYAITFLGMPPKEAARYAEVIANKDPIWKMPEDCYYELEVEEGKCEWKLVASGGNEKRSGSCKKSVGNLSLEKQQRAYPLSKKRDS